MLYQNSQRTGTWIKIYSPGESYQALIPALLPPKPPLELGTVQRALEEASHWMGTLEGVTQTLEDASLLVYSFIRKEALLSSQIEGTQSTYTDLVLYEGGEEFQVPLEDIEEVSSYIAALNHGIRRLQEGFPLSLRLIREIHEILLSGRKATHLCPGEFRRSQNWIGGTRPGNAFYVPPPPDKVMECMGSLEKFMHENSPELPLTVQAGLIHAQFEAIHPFLDGNGRTGRLLITLFLIARGLITTPTLYSSLYFKRHRTLYYEMLSRVYTQGEWEAWLDFFLKGMIESAKEATFASRQIVQIFHEDHLKIKSLPQRLAKTCYQVHQLLKKRPIVSIGHVAQELRVSFPTATLALTNLEHLGIVKKASEKKRSRLFVYQNYIAILSKDTDPF